MSSIPAPVDATESASHPVRLGAGLRQLSPRALIYLGLVATAAVAASAPFVPHLSPRTPGWATFAVLASAAAVAQLFRVQTPRNQSYHTTAVFLLPAALLLRPELVVLVPVVQHVPEWLKSRTPWFIQVFNMCNYTLSTLAAWGSARVVLSTSPQAGHATLIWAAAGLAASVAFVVVNHVLLAEAMRLARGHSLRESGLFTYHSLSAELVLATLGVAVATFWRSNPWLVAFAIAPLVLIHRSLHVPQLEEEARVDPKTGLFNARHFASVLADELARANRFQRPLAVLMADLDLLREINNTYGHLAGDAVLKAIAEVFRAQLRHYDVPARFGGEEFCILLPETSSDQALEIAERVRRAVASREVEIEASSDPISATVSIGVASFPKDGADASELVHQADLAVYRAKLQGRNRVLAASSEPFLLPEARAARLATVPEDGEHVVPLPARLPERTLVTERRHPRPHAVRGPRFFALSRRLGLLVGAVSLAGALAGAAGLVLGNNTDAVGMVAVVLLVAVGQVLALEVDDGSISVSAVGALAGAALFGPRIALPLAIAIAAVGWSTRRSPLHQMLFNVGSLALASLAAAGIFSPTIHAGGPHKLVTAAAGCAAGAAFFVVNTGLLSVALAAEGHERGGHVWRERFLWLLPHYIVYGFVAGVIAIAYAAAGLYALAVFALPLLLMRKTQEAYLTHTQRSARKLREAAETIQSQNVSLEHANRALRDRSTAAMESLSATVDARDAYTAGHSRRVQQLALKIGRELGLSRAELDVLGYAALFHDIGKLAIPDTILLKPGALTQQEWALMQRHPEEGARIIERLGFLEDAVPAILHHHERYDGAGYPEGIASEDIPLGARIIHVADAFDSMVTTRIYRPSLTLAQAIAELRAHAGTQFCPRCAAALERVVESPEADESLRADALLAAS